MVIGGPARSLSQEMGDSPRFLGNPCACMPRSSTPVGRPLLALAESVDVAFRLDNTVGPTMLPSFRGSITQPTCSLSTLHRVGHPSTVQDSLPVRWLDIAGTGLSPIGFRTRISRGLSHLLSQRARLAWRTIHLRRDSRWSIAYSEELIFPISATLQSTDRHHGIVGQERCHFQLDS